jgi:hypothetical protein
MLWDKVKAKEKIRVERWHGGVQGARHGLVLLLSTL